MLAEVRHALAETLAAGMPTCLVLPCPPQVIDWPESGVVVWVQPAADYLETWLSFSRGGTAALNYDVIVTIPAAAENAVDPGPEWDAMDAAIDPISTSQSVFGALVGTEGQGVDLGVSEYATTATPMLQNVGGFEFVTDGAGAVTRIQVSIPVRVLVKRS